jgi:hypothetical protein
VERVDITGTIILPLRCPDRPREARDEVGELAVAPVHVMTRDLGRGPYAFSVEGAREVID